jgi:hypothetical protein
LNYTIWLSMDGETWNPFPAPGTKTTHSPFLFASAEDAERVANNILCEGMYRFARVYDRTENVVSEFEVKE